MTEVEIRAKLTTIMTDFDSGMPRPSAETRAAIIDLAAMVLSDLHTIASRPAPINRGLSADDLYELKANR